MPDFYLKMMAFFLSLMKINYEKIHRILCFDKQPIAS